MESGRKKPRFGYRRLHVLRVGGGERVNHKRVFRVQREAGLTVRRKTRKRLVREGSPRTALTAANQEWARCHRQQTSNILACIHPPRTAHASFAGSGHQLCESASDAGAGDDSVGAGKTAGDSLRQRAGLHQPAFSGEVHQEVDRAGAHPAGEAAAERKIVAWQKEFNEERPHSALGWSDPAAYARQLPNSLAHPKPDVLVSM